MNPYDNATITVKKFECMGDRIYGELRTADGELLVSASLGHITKVLEERMTKIEENGMTFKDKTNEEMVELYKKQANKMSFFNAAEGQSWYAEATERQACQSELKNIREEFIARNLDLPNGNWLM